MWPMYIRNFLFLLFLSACIPFSASAATTWTEVVNDSFSRANSSTVGNDWVDAAGLGSIVSNTLQITSSAGVNASSEGARILRPSSEASLNQRIDMTWTAADTSASIEHGAVLRSKSAVFGSTDIQPAIAVMYRHSGMLNIQLSYNGLINYIGSGYTGTTTFTPVVGRSYTMSVNIVNNFPAVVTATITDNASSTQVANISYNVNGKYETSDIDFSPYWKTAGVAGLAFSSGSAGSIVTFTNVKTYSYSDPGSFATPAAIKSEAYGGVFYLATPLPVGGTPPYTIRWYRGANGFSPPTNINGTGGGTGTFISTGQEVTDSNAPTGVSNFSITYKAVYFDSGAASTTGSIGPGLNLNSPSTKPLAIPVWIGDSITYGFNTSNSYAKSPAQYAMTELAASSTITAVWTPKFFDSYAIRNAAFPGRTSADMATTYLPGLASFAADREINFMNVMLGTNDAKDSVNTSATAYKSNIQTIISTLKSVNSNMKVVLNKPTWFKPNTGYGSDFSSSSLTRIAEYSDRLDQLADGTSVVVGDFDAYNEIAAYGWTGSVGVNNPSNAVTSYPPAPTGGKSYLTDGLHPYDGGAQMMSVLEWTPNMRSAMLGNYTPAYDGTAPVISSIASSTGQTTATVSFLTDESATSTLDYGTTSSYGTASSSNIAATSTTFSLTGLTASTLYHFRISAWDEEGNLATSSDLTFTTADVPDTTPPTVSITAPLDASTVTTWSPAVSWGDAATCEYKFDSDSFAALVCGSNGSDIPTPASGSHTLTVQGTDASANAATTSVSFTYSTGGSSDDYDSSHGRRGDSKKSSVADALSDPDTGCSSGNNFNTQTGKPCSGLVTDIVLAAPIPYTFTRDLMLRSVGEDVRALQAYLNTHGFPVASEGLGSIGNETDYFGSLTAQALARFQASKGIVPSIGYFGPITRRIIELGSGL